MNIGWLTVGMIGVAALGTLLYRTYKLENNLPKLPNPPARPRSTQSKRSTPYEGDMRVSESRSYSQIKNTTPEPVAVDDDAMDSPPPSASFATVPILLLLGIAALAVVLPGDYRISTTLGLVQGLGEFLPISSSAHLIITPWLFGWYAAGAARLLLARLATANHVCRTADE
jgi:undecaprenyl-diphosphatase